ncbi:MAG: DapH/DapD/GlmU-related protein [Ferruginibacter sp.]
MTIPINELAHSFKNYFSGQQQSQPWEILSDIELLIKIRIETFNEDYVVTNNIAIHKTAIIEAATIKPPAIIGPFSFVGANAYLRGGVFLGKGVKIGTGCEIKSSIILDNSAIAHFNFIGDSIIGDGVNFEAGSITANHFNERVEKKITVKYQSLLIATGVVKFGSLIGDHSKIGANAVLSRGTILKPNSIVKRLELIDQMAS